MMHVIVYQSPFGCLPGGQVLSVLHAANGPYASASEAEAVLFREGFESIEGEGAGANGFTHRKVHPMVGNQFAVVLEVMTGLRP